ncbi:hypothetical protein Ddc_09776 [Ditylenchus destructor]|nr:hypothetical protein Ddc_09776 [Ditylenchus destructor]
MSEITETSFSASRRANIWRLLPLEAQLDVFKCLKAYDLRKNGINVCRRWRNVINQYEKELPKFRPQIVARALIGDNTVDHEKWRQAAVNERLANIRKARHERLIIPPSVGQWLCSRTYMKFTALYIGPFGFNGNSAYRGVSGIRSILLVRRGNHEFRLQPVPFFGLCPLPQIMSFFSALSKSFILLG